MRYDFETKTFSRTNGAYYNLFMRKVGEYYAVKGYLK